MSHLPQPGPGRPQHPSYSEPGLQASPLELIVLVVAVALIVFSASGICSFVGQVL